VFGSIFRRGGEGRGGEQNTSKSQFLLPPNWRDLEGRGGKLILILLN
jgi:hypothetical protein